MRQATPRAPDECLESFFFRVHGEPLRRAESPGANGELKPKACSGNLLLSGSHAMLQLRGKHGEERELSMVCYDLDMFTCSLIFWALDSYSCSMASQDSSESVKHCCGLALAGSSVPHSCLLAVPRWDGEENWKNTSARTHGLR